MTILRKYFSAGSNEVVIPGKPGYPGSPAYCVDTVINHPGGTGIAFIPYPPHEAGDPIPGIPGGSYGSSSPGGYFQIPVTGPPTSELVHNCYPAVPPVPAGPPTRIPAISAKYYEGWNAAADSIPSLTGNGIYQVTGDASSVGVVTGLTNSPTGVTYSNITHGIYFASGQYQYVENGTPSTPKRAFDSTDVFTIVRIGEQVTFYKGSTLDYISGIPSTGIVWADASLYFGGDQILDALIDTTVPPDKGNAGYPLPPAGPYPPATPPGTLPLYTSVNGILQGLRTGVFGDNQVNLPPGPNPGDPGMPPTVDGNGDWQGRSGSTLRSLTGTFIGNGGGNYNYGSVNGTLDSVQGATFSVGGASNYSILRGTLDPVSGDAGAGLLAPQHVVMDGYLDGLGGFSYGIGGGTTGTLTGRLLGLRGFATDLEGGWVGPGDTPPFVDPIGGGGGGPTTLYHDTFTGTTTLDLHVPDVGVPYLLDGGNPLDLLTLTGSALPIGDGSGGNFDIEQPLDVSATPSYRTRHVLQIDSVGSAGNMTIDVALDAAETDDWFYEWWFVAATDGSIVISFWIYGADGSELFEVDAIDLTSAFTLGVPHTMTMTITPTGVVWALDGTELANSGGIVSDGVVTGIEANFRSYADASAVFDEIEVAPLGVGGTPGIPGWEPDASGDWLGRSGGQLRNIVGHLYSADAVLLPEVYSFFKGELSGYLLQASGHTIFGVSLGFDAKLSGYSFKGYGGGSAVGKLPLLAFTGSGTVTILGKADLALSGYEFLASGTTTSIGQAYATYKGPYALTGYGGGQMVGAHGGHYALSGHGIVGAVGRADCELPSLILTGSGTVHNFGVLDATLPALIVAASSSAVLALSHYVFVGSGHEGFATAYEAYSITLIPTDAGGETTATTHYPTYPFDRILRFGDDYYGVAADGLYRLDGDTFDGVEIISVVETAQTDFKERSAKRPVSLFLAGRMDTKLKVSVTAAEDVKNTYTYTGTWEGVGNQRVRFGRGIKARYLSYGFTNHTGEDFDVDELAPEIEVLRRNQ